MTVESGFTFKVASEESEFDRIHELNHRTFTEEIPQHPSRTNGRLVDKFHEENTYLICLAGNELAGMLAARGERPFSLDAKVPGFDRYLPPNRSVCEVRLLAIDKRYRSGQVLPGLMALLRDFFESRGHDLAVISGTTEQLRLYRHLGFVPFGPLVGTESAQFQPMYLTREAAAPFFPRINHREGATRTLSPATHNFLPGPVSLHPDVRRAFEQPPVSHRSPEFISTLQRLKAELLALTGANHVQTLLGSGTLANDAVAGQLSLDDEFGLIIVNGEFGERLTDHAQRAQLPFVTLREPWGAPIDCRRVEAVLEESGAQWLWMVHGETSTGVLNPLDAIRTVCQERGTRLALDCMSTIGMTEVDLSGISLATATSGKGLASYPGIALVFHSGEIQPRPAQLPRYLDIGLYAANPGVPFTHSSNLVGALLQALDRQPWSEKFERVERASLALRRLLEGFDLPVLACVEDALPGVLTIPLPGQVSSEQIGTRLARAGFEVAWRSSYLLERNWIQFCLMGEFSEDEVTKLAARLRRVLSQDLPQTHRRAPGHTLS